MAKMQTLADRIENVHDIPHFVINCDDKIMSSITIYGSFQDNSEWNNKIYQNSPYFIFQIVPEKGERYYEGEKKVCVELISASHKLENGKFRKYTGPIEKVVDKINAWIESNKVPTE